MNKQSACPTIYGNLQELREWVGDDEVAKQLLRGRITECGYWIDHVSELKAYICNHAAPEAVLVIAPILLDEIKATRRKINDFNYWLDIIDGKVKPAKNKVDVEAVKAVPIGDIMPSKPAAVSGDRAKYPCPLHNEKEASFVVYRASNKWHCFGCQEHGDVVDLYQKLNNCDFKTALSGLNNLI